jgi:hypothetical protein
VTDADGDLAVAATTPPHTDSEDVSTPPPHGHPHHHEQEDVDMAMADDILGSVSLEYATALAAASAGEHAIPAAAGVGGGAAGAGNNFDFDQWLQFPAEAGLGSGDDTFMGGMFGAAAGAAGEHGHLDLGGELGGGIEWMGNLPEGISH